MHVYPPVTWLAAVCITLLHSVRSSVVAAGRLANSQLHYLLKQVSYHSRTAMLHLLHCWFIYPDILQLLLLSASLSLFHPQGLFFFFLLFYHLFSLITKDLINGSLCLQGRNHPCWDAGDWTLLISHHHPQSVGYLKSSQLLFSSHI